MNVFTKYHGNPSNNVAVETSHQSSGLENGGLTDMALTTKTFSLFQNVCACLCLLLHTRTQRLLNSNWSHCEVCENSHSDHIPVGTNLAGLHAYVKNTGVDQLCGRRSHTMFQTVTINTILQPQPLQLITCPKWVMLISSVFSLNLSVNSFEAAWDMQLTKIRKGCFCCCPCMMTHCHCLYAAQSCTRAIKIKLKI